MMRIHGVNLSPYVRKVRAVMIEKGLAHEVLAVLPPAVSDEFRKISPLGKIPVLEDGDFTVPDSSCIVAYLERVQPEPPFYLADPKLYAKALFYEEYGDTKLYDTLAPVFIQRIVVPNVMKGTPDDTIIQGCLAAAPAVFDYLEAALGDGTWLVGDRFSIADVAVASPFVNWTYAGESVDAGRWPKLAAYIERVCARPSFQSLIEEERADMAAMG